MNPREMEKRIKQLEDNQIKVIMTHQGDTNVYRAVERVLIGTANLYIGISPATARLHIGAGTANKYTAPVKLTAGTLMTTAETGAFEYDGTNLYFTPVSTRLKIGLVTAGGATIATGTYTPTLTNTTNLDASTPRLATYMRVGDTVTVAGQLDLDPTAGGAVLLGISLPIASNFSTAFQLGGVASTTTIANESAGIESDAANDRASLKYIAVDTTNHTMTYTFTYQII